MELVLYLQLFIIRPTLMYLEPEIRWSVAAEKLLLGTAAQESHLGHLLASDATPIQLYQMESATEKDIWENYLAYHPKLKIKVLKLRSRSEQTYAAAMVRIHYWRRMDANMVGSIEHISWMWKIFYNTSKGKGTTVQFTNTYRRLIEGRLAISLDRKSSSPASPVYVRGD